MTVITKNQYYQHEVQLVTVYVTDRHRPAGIYLHCSEAWTVDDGPGLGLSIYITT